MKKVLLAAGMSALMSTTAVAENIGVSIALLEHNFLAVMANGMTDYADANDNVTLQMEDATNDVAK